MNDIEILEELVKSFDNLISYRQKQAIENLIKRNKDLEEIIDTLSEGIENHFIPKSKVRELIKELDNLQSDISKKIFKDNTGTWLRTIQNFLKRELLQEGDK